MFRVLDKSAIKAIASFLSRDGILSVIYLQSYHQLYKSLLRWVQMNIHFLSLYHYCAIDLSLCFSSAELQKEIMSVFEI